MAFEELKAKKKELGYSNKYISEKTGIPIGTIQKFFSGTTKAPRRETIQLIENLLMIPEIQTSTEQDVKEKDMLDFIKEMRKKALEGKLLPHKSLSLKNYVDCVLWNSEGMLEVIEGKEYICPESDHVHSMAVGEIMIQLDSYIEAKRKRDLVLINPVDVFLNKDEYTVVHPDISVLRNRYMYEDGLVFGAPDFIIEVVTPESQKVDTIIKYYRYALAGVKEYWTVHLAAHYVTVYDMENAWRTTYSFENKVPVKIWDQDFSVDFSKIKEKLER